MSQSLRQLIKGFAVLDHAQFMAGPFFYGFHAFLQFKNFCIEDAITLQQARILGMLFGNLLGQLGQVGYLRQAPVTHPKAVLQASQQQEQDKEQPVGTAHRISFTQ